MPAELFAGIGAFKSALDIARGIKDISDAVARNQAIIDLQQTILDAQQAQQALILEVSELKERLKSVDDKRAELAKYEMVDVRNSGEFAYRLKKEASEGKPAHLACPACFESGKISTLHASGSSDGQDWYTCRACDKNMSFGRYVSSYNRSDRGSDYF